MCLEGSGPRSERRGTKMQGSRWVGLLDLGLGFRVWGLGFRA